MTPTTAPALVGIDIAFIALILFLGFFTWLVFWLHRESKREGYPLEKDAADLRMKSQIIGFPAPPPTKTYATTQGDVAVAGGRPDTRPLALKPVETWPGAPFEPTGDPLADGVGPASWAERADKPDVLFNNQPRLAPLRAAPDFHVETRDPNPVGMTVVAGNGETVGTIRDVWIDKAEYVIRYLEAEIATSPGLSRRVLVPINFARIDGRAGKVHVKALFAKDFANVPGIKGDDVVTLLEEDKIMGYFGGGTLYASRKRLEPFL